MSEDRKALADDRAPICPYCGCTRHDSERRHDGNVMAATDLVDAMISAFLRDPREPQPVEIRPRSFPENYTEDHRVILRSKMQAALDVAVRNMPYLESARGEVE